MRIKTRSELLATGVYTESDKTSSYTYTHDDRSGLSEAILGKRIKHKYSTIYEVESSGEWHLNKDCIETKEDNILKILEKIDEGQE